MQTTLKDLGITLVSLAGPDAAGVTVIEDVDGSTAPGSTTWQPTSSWSVRTPSSTGAGSNDDATELATGFLTQLGGLEPVAV